MRNHHKTDRSVIVGVYDINLWNDQTRTFEHHRIEVRVDGEQIAKILGVKAIVSKVRKSRSIHGAVTVTDCQKLS